MAWSWRFKNLNSAATTTITTGATELMTVNVNTAAAGSTVKIYADQSANAVNLIANIDGGTIASKGYGVYCPLGLTVVIAGGSPDVTIGYR